MAVDPVAATRALLQQAVDAGFALNQIAQVTGLSRQYLHKFLGGKIVEPKRVRLTKLRSHLKRMLPDDA